MVKSWASSAVVGVIVLGIGSFLWLNLEPPKSPANQATKAPSAPLQPLAGTGAPIREYPIGDEVEKNQIRIAAVWLPAVIMDNMPSDPTMHMIHVEADIKALEGNPNGFAKDEKIDYLKVTYKLAPAAGGSEIAGGPMIPMMARDGFHYGATIAMPAPGRYTLTYTIPAPEGLGRHSDPATGVAPWWEPFDVSFDWVVEAEPKVATVSLR